MSANTIALSLISHTNAGKTTLARTLLGRDIGEVRDAPHVTVESTSYPLVSTPEGDSLVLWDTPGFGDSARLARRLAQQGNPIGWFLSQVWDRFRDKPFYLSQMAVRNVRDDADVVLYLVNASEAPEDAGYLVPELDVLAWIGRPVFVLLNQTGPPRPRDAESGDESRWRDAAGLRPFIRGVLTLDAFARCWVQEIVLLRALAPAIAPEKSGSYDRLADAWQARRVAEFDEAMSALAGPIARAALDSEQCANPGLKDRIRGILQWKNGEGAAEGERTRAVQRLAERLDMDLRESTSRLIAIYGLEGRAANEILERVAEHLRTDSPLDEGTAAMIGGVLSGAMSGLAADVAAGGLTFGAGTLVGAIAGALGGAGIARGYNVLSGRTGSTIRWDDELLTRLVNAALLRYLAVAHFGRGRGEWKESECPGYWREVVKREIDARAAPLAELWGRRDSAGHPSAIEGDLRRILADAAYAMLDALYPGVPWNPQR